MTLALVITAALVLIAGLFAVIVERTTERDEAREQVTRLESECNAHAAVSADLARRLAEAESTTVRVPLLRVVPPQRDSEHDRLALSRDEWDAIVRETEGL